MKKNISKLGILLALAFVLSYLENLIPLNLAVPGIKIGFANIVIVFILLSYGYIPAFIVAIIRNLLVSATFGNFSLFIYSMAGSVLSLLIMSFIINIKFKKINLFGISSISMFGGIFHNIGQLLIATLLLSNINLFYYMPILILIGALTGFIIGLIVEKILYIEKYK